ncbi:MAG: hypothetical protein IKL57_05485, partial [Oscillospiraceae bacterium]|nr:hypothetical protein [Oscillospiraceae bacterium]
ANENGDTYYVLQGRDERGLRSLAASDFTWRYGKSAPLLFREDNNFKQLLYMIDNEMTTEEVVNTFAIKTSADDSVLGFKYGFLAEYAGYHNIENYELKEASVLSIDSANLVVGETGKVSVKLSEDSDATMLQFAIKYDPEVVEILSCTAGEAVADATINSENAGYIYFAWDSLTSLEEAATLLDIEFNVVAEDSCDTYFEFVTEDEEFIVKRSDLSDIVVETVNGTISYVGVIYGDVDLNGKVNVLDANLVRRYAAKQAELTDVQLVAADVDGNEKVNVLDANLIRRFAAKVINIFPVEE